MGAAEALGGALHYALGDAFRIGEDIRIPEPNDVPALGAQKVGTDIVSFDAFEMLAAIELDRQLRLTTGEIDDEGGFRPTGG